MRRLLTIFAVLALLVLSVAGASATTAQQQAAMTPATAKAGCTYFPLTQHNLCAGFLRYWETYGGLAVYGYPLTEEFQEVNPDTGKTYTVQYFERTRSEWHPEFAGTPNAIELGRLAAIHLMGPTVSEVA